MTPTIIDSRELDIGDVILNFGDTIYATGPHDRMAHEHVLRLAGYLLFAGRVGLPTRHLVQNEALFTLVRWVPELLQDGLVFGDVPRGVTSFSANVASAQYRTPEAETRAVFLDQHSKVMHEFDATGMMAAFHRRFALDLAEDGPLARLIERERPAGGSVASANLRAVVAQLPPLRHDAFVEALHASAPEGIRDLLTRWASIRYYTTPMDFDYCIRDIPHEASALMLRAEAALAPHVQDPDVAAVVPEPMRSAIEVMEMGFPVTYTEGDARCLLEAVLKTRQDVPEAREKFSSVVSVAFEDKLVGEINGLLRRNLAEERILKSGSPSLSDSFRLAVKDGGAEAVAHGLIHALEIGTAWLGPVVGGVRGALMARHEEAEMRERAPWKVTCEYLGHAYDHARRSQLRAILKSEA